MVVSGDHVVGVLYDFYMLGVTSYLCGGTGIVTPLSTVYHCHGRSRK